MTLLATADWVIDGKVVSSDTSPIDLEIVAAVEKSLELTGRWGSNCTISLRLQFDPPLWTPQAPMEGSGERLSQAVYEALTLRAWHTPPDWKDLGDSRRDFYRAAVADLLKHDVIRVGRGV